MVDDGGGDFAGTICPICYEDLKPITEDLQSISICGHVFHERCLQKWFGYCLKANKHTCPVCKQSCKAKDACRLYFQSLGDVDEAVIARKPLDSEEDAGVLLKEVKRLEVKVSVLCSELDRKVEELEELTKEVDAYKEQEKVEVLVKNEALKQNALIESQFRMMSEEFRKSTFECSRLQERNMALVKETATLKLEYRELMSKCNLMGRVEDRYSKMIEKSNEIIVKLKARVQKLETAAEVRENQYLMSLKASKRKKCSNNVENSINSNADVSKACKISLHGQKKQTSKLNSEMVPNVNNIDSLQFLRTENCIATENEAETLSKGSKPTQSLDMERKFISIDDEASEFVETFPGRSRNDRKVQVMDSDAPTKPTVVESGAPMQEKRNLAVSLRIDVDIEMANISAEAMDDDATILANIKQVQPIVNIRKEFPLTNADPVDICFSGELFGPDGSNRYLDKWCKRGLNNESTSAKGSGKGDFIVIGADGRGRKIKVVRTPNQTFLDVKEYSLSSKRLKSAPKTSSLKPQGCLQIEHFFGKTTQ